MALALTPQVFAIFATFLAEKVGLHYGPSDRELFAEKAGTHAQDLGFESMLDYYYTLRYDDHDGRALAALVEALVVNETYFFREHGPLEQLVEHKLVPMVARGARPRVWSAACSTGEEPLSLAMLLDDRGVLDRVEIVASDISARVLERARGGKWSARAIRDSASSPLVDRYLRRDDRGWTIDERLRRAIDWRRANLVDPSSYTGFGLFDAILCRNVLIYFADDTTSRVVSDLAGRLEPDGWLLVGISESLLRFRAPLSCEEIGGAFVYRKVA